MISRQRHIAASLAIVLLSSALSYVCVQFLPFLNLAEQWLSDYRISSLTPPVEPSDDIVVLTVTEDTLAQFPYRSPLDRVFLAEVLQQLDQRHVRAIGIDVLFDQPTEHDKDELLKNTIEKMRTPLVIGYADQNEGLSDAQSIFINDFVREEHRGFVILLKDSLSNTVRWIYPGREISPGTFIKGFVPALAETLGIQTLKQDVPIVWRPPPPQQDKTTFAAYPIHALEFLPAEWFSNKIVLIGSDLPGSDRHKTPFTTTHRQAGILPGVVIHAHALSQLIENLQSPQLANETRVLLIVASALVGTALAFLEMNLALRFLLTVLVVAAYAISGFALYNSGHIMVPVIGPIIALVLGIWMMEARRRYLEREQKRYLKNAFSRYVAPDVVDLIAANPEALTLGGESREMSYIFTDIAGFTTLSEREEATAVSSLLNQYLSETCEIAFRHEGTVSDFIGDAVFILFNAPLPQMNHGQLALACARDIDQFAEDFRQRDMPRKMGLGVTRIGVHTGRASIGNMGADQHFKYSPIGDSVNTAARLEGLNKYFGTRVCVSESTLKEFPSFPVRPMGRVVVKGKQEALSVFELLGEQQSPSTYMSEYRRAYAMLDKGDANAEAILRELHEQHPEDGCVVALLDQIELGNLSTRIVMAEK